MSPRPMATRSWTNPTPPLGLLAGALRRGAARTLPEQIALEAALRLSGPNAERWRALFLTEWRMYLKGARAPASLFRDHVNQVLLPRDHYWGGAVEASAHWYAKLTGALRSRAWSEAAFAAGVLCAYVSAPTFPLRAGQSEHQGAVQQGLLHAAAAAYPEFVARLDGPLGWPQVDAPRTADWLSRLVRAGADRAVEAYDLCIDRFDLGLAVETPTAAPDDVLKDELARLVGHAVMAFAAIVERAAALSGAQPPRRNPAPAALAATLALPTQWTQARLEDAAAKRQIAAVLDEVRSAGKAIATLSEAEATVRRAHAEEVLHLALDDLDARPARPHGTQYGKPAPGLGGRRRASDLSEAPGIGPRTADRFRALGILTLGDLIDADARRLASMLAMRQITEAAVRDWQDMARLAIAAPSLRASDAQLLVLCGVRSAEDLANADAGRLLTQIRALLGRAEARATAPGATAPALADARRWIAAARRAA